ncbi:amidohydrolase family protein [bacterium]|nr:amidohydrolase family protein [bacterium]
MKRFVPFIPVVFLLLVSSLIAATDTYIKAKKIYIVSGAGIIENGIILIRDGRIVDVRKNMNIPPEAEIIEAEVVIPGLVDMHSHVGVYSLPLVKENEDGNEMTNPCTPQVRALDSFNWEDPAIEAGRMGGVTTVVSRPGSGNIIGGTSVAVKLKAASPNEMVLKEICDLKMAIEGNPVGVYKERKQAPSTLMSVYHLAEKAFTDAQKYQSEWETYKKKQKKDKSAKVPKRDLGKESLVMALTGEIPVHIHCATASEIVSCIRLARQFNLRLSLGHAYWAHLLVDELEYAKDVHFNIGPPMFFGWYDDPLTFRNNPAILADRGFKVSLQTDALGGAQQNLRHLAMLCVRYGMKPADALRAITLTAAEAVDLADRIGSIEKGKDADLVLLTGEPFDMLSEVARVIIDGKVEFVDSNLPTLITPYHADHGKILALPDGLDKAEKIAIRGGTVYTMEGAPVENGVVLIKNGLIHKVGANLSIPGGYKIIDADGFTVMPGLISPRSFVGIGTNWRRQAHTDETSASITPAMNVKHAIEPTMPSFNYCRSLGVTTTLVTPGNRNVIGGQGAVLKTHGIIVDKMIVKEKAVVMAGLGKAAKREKAMPTTRMGIAALMRETLIKAQDYQKKLKDADKDKKAKAPDKDWDSDALLPVLRRETPLMVHAERLDDILTAMRIADEFNIRIILDGATDAYKVIDEIKKRNIPVILEDLLRGAGGVEDHGFKRNQPALLSAAGIPVAFRAALQTGWFSPKAGEPGGDLLEIAAFAVKNGMHPDAALRAITIDAARIIEVDETVGSLKAGKDADVLILRGHPFSTTSVPEAVFIDGCLRYRRQDGVHLISSRK